jgi:hypothetical protein
MGLRTSIILIAGGSILRFAPSVATTVVNLHTLGLILISVGIFRLMLSVTFRNSWGGFGDRGSRVAPNGAGAICRRRASQLRESVNARDSGRGSVKPSAQGGANPPYERDTREKGAYLRPCEAGRHLKHANLSARRSGGWNACG